MSCDVALSHRLILLPYLSVIYVAVPVVARMILMQQAVRTSKLPRNERPFADYNKRICVISDGTLKFYDIEAVGIQ